MRKTTISAVVAAAILAGCGSSHTSSRSSLISATVPSVATTGAAATVTSSAPATSTAPATATSSAPATPAQTPQATTPAKTIAVPSTGPLTAAQFKAAANTICTKTDTQARAIGPADSSPDSAAGVTLGKLEAISKRAVVALTTLEARGPAASVQQDREFIAFVEQQDAIGARAAHDADTGNAADYTKQLQKLSALAGDETAAGTALAPACAQG
jgi:hypothetical protein